MSQMTSEQVYVHHSVNSVRVGGCSFAIVCPWFSNSLPNDGTFALSLYFSLRSVSAYNTIRTVGPYRLCSLVYVFFRSFSLFFLFVVRCGRVSGPSVSFSAQTKQFMSHRIVFRTTFRRKKVITFISSIITDVI